MSANSPTFYSIQYASAVSLLSQQLVSKIAPLFTQMTAEGKSATQVDQVGSTEANERNTRYAPITPANIALTKPWIYPRFFDAAEMFDTIDKLKMNANPTSEYVRALVAAMNRKMDVIANEAFWADRKLGEDGASTESFSASQQIGTNVGGTASGMNVEKLQAGLELLKTNEIDMDAEQVYCVIGPKQERNLMNEIEVISSDYTKGMVMESGRIKRFLGVEFVLSNRLTADGSSLRRCPLFVRSGMTFCTWGGGVKTSVDQRKDLAGHPWQAYVEANFGAARREPSKVVEIKCTEA